MKRACNFEYSSGNVFADLNIPNPEKALAKAELAIKINSIIKRKKLTKKQAADILGVDQAKITSLQSGKISSFSLDRLFKFLNNLGQDINILVRPKSKTCEKGKISINEKIKH